MMLFDFLRNGRKKSLVSTWFWIIIVVVLTRRGNTNTIHSKAENCDEQPTAVTCNLTSGNKGYNLIAFDWENATKVIIHANGNMVSIKRPYRYTNGTSCDSKQHEVTIENASRVTTEQETADNDNFCPFQLILSNCQGVNIDRFVDLVRMTSTKAERVVLPRVEQFDLQDSTVQEVDLEIVGKKSVIKNSNIMTVTRLIIAGNFEFTIKNSTLSHVKRFIYNSDQNISLDKLAIDYLFNNGFHVIKGTLTLQDSAINDMETNSIIVSREGKLTLSQTKLRTRDPKSIVVTSGGGIKFTHITLGTYANVSFELRDSSIDLYPLVFLMEPPMVSTVWVAIGVIFGLLVGSSTAVAAMIYIKKRFNYKIPSQDPSCQSLTTEMEVCETNALSKSSTLLTRPLPKVPDEEPDVDYIDVKVSSDSQVRPKPRMDQRPPVPIQKKLPYTPGINTERKPVLPSLPKPKTTNNQYTNDIRDILPPPPPPEDGEELYDDLECSNSAPRFVPQPPPPARKPVYHPR